MQYLVNDQAQFDGICQRILQTKTNVYLDTEFVRKGRTFHAVLSLIQIGAEIPNDPNGSIRAVVDAFLVKDLTLFGQILADHEILKVLHAPSEDFRIFLHLFQALPKNVFDTQCAAAVSDVIPGAGGNGNCIGYGKLCKAVLDIDVDKSMQNTDWERRPLTSRHLDYAILDVEYLIPLERILGQRLSQSGMWSKYLVELASTVMKPEAYKPQPEKLVRRMCQNTLDWYVNKGDQFADVTFENATQVLPGYNGISGKKGPAKGDPSVLNGKKGPGGSAKGSPNGVSSSTTNGGGGGAPLLSGGSSSCSTSATSSKTSLPHWGPSGGGKNNKSGSPLTEEHSAQLSSPGTALEDNSFSSGINSVTVGTNAAAASSSSSPPGAPGGTAVASSRSSSHQSTVSLTTSPPDALGRHYVLAASAKPTPGPNKKSGFHRRFHAFLHLREDVAAERDVPRQGCASDEALMELVCWLPASDAELRDCTQSARSTFVKDAQCREVLLAVCRTFKQVAEYERRLAVSPGKGGGNDASKGLFGAGERSGAGGNRNYWGMKAGGMARNNQYGGGGKKW
eukprot:g6265.t1